MTDTTPILRGMYAAEADYLAAGGAGTASFEPLAAFFAVDVALHQAEALPYGGVWRGHGGIEAFFAVMSETWERFDMVQQRFLATGAVAVVWTQVDARARGTGAELRFPILQTLTVAEDRVTEVHPFYWDTAAIADACGA